MEFLKGLVDFFFSGQVLAFMGASLAAAFGGWGSAKGVGLSGETAAGILSEKPELFGKLLILQALPGTQGIYGLLVWFMVMVKGGFLAGTSGGMSTLVGMQFFMACVPSMVVLYFSAILQGRVAANGMMMVAKQPGEQSKAIVLAAMVETYAILALLASMLMILLGIKV
ncbi:MAG: V-type ATP synthase subunit K [Clostridia bacterium]|nr:V-type ATP synthase subunit K [Clostridia bacterium]